MGALLLHTAAVHCVTAAGCTLSDAQYQAVRERIGVEALEDSVRVFLSHYRDLDGGFTKIASVGVFEHVGRRRLPNYFKCIAGLMKPDGLFLNHGITRPQTVREDPDTVFLRKHFPGGDLPRLSDVIFAA